jgi:hypothetical protein
VDIAVLPWEQRHIVEKAVAAWEAYVMSETVLQSISEAVEMTRLAKQAGLKIAVHQQFSLEFHHPSNKSPPA